MGVDFSWGGSASYPRYYDEVEQIAVKCFGAVLNTKFIEDNEKVSKNLLNPSYMFGTVHERDDKFIFPENTPEAIIEFCKKPCEPHDAKPIWEAF